MLLHSISFILGLGILYLGAKWLVRGASEVAKRFGIRPMIIGLTVVALGTSLPEFLLNVFAVSMGEDGLAIGNIIGSNIANIALILGVSASITPLIFNRDALRKEYPMMLGVTALFYVLALDGLVSRMDGSILIAGLVAFMIYVIRDAVKSGRNPDETPATEVTCSDESGRRSGLRAIMKSPKMVPYARALLIVGGMAALTIGARLMVDAAIGIASFLEIAPIIIGLTIVAIGTSLPELAATLMCAIRKESDMSVGNILGSNMLNILFVVGFVAVLRPIEVETVSINVHFPVMIVFSLALYPLARPGHKLSRSNGIVLLVAFITYLVWLIYPNL